MKVSDAMNRTVILSDDQATIKELWTQLFDKKINAVPIVDKKSGKLLGIVTKEDVLQLIYPQYGEFMGDVTSFGDFEEMEEKISSFSSKKAGEIMSKRVIFTRENTPLLRALSRMIVRKVSQLPVLREDDTLAGMITKGDVFYALFKAKMTVKDALIENTKPQRKKKK